MSDGWAPYLKEGEQILWEGRPDGRVYLLDKAERFKLVLALLWIMLILYLFASTAEGGVLVFFSALAQMPLLLQVLLIVGFAYFGVGRWLLDAHSRRHTVYALSNKRAFIAHSAFKRNLRDMPITPDMQVKFRNDKLGSITFGPKPSLFQRNNKWTVDDGSFTFRGLEDAQDVLRRVANIQEKAERS